VLEQAEAASETADRAVRERSFVQAQLTQWVGVRRQMQGPKVAKTQEMRVERLLTQPALVRM